MKRTPFQPQPRKNGRISRLGPEEGHGRNVPSPCRRGTGIDRNEFHTSVRYPDTTD